MIPVYVPYLNKKTLKYAHDALDSSWITQGKYIELCERFLEEYLGVKHVLLTNNGTTATHLVSKGLTYYYAHKFNNPLYELIVPNNVYVAAWNSFLFSDNLIQLIPIDADLDTWNYDLNKLDKEIKLRPNATVLIVHNVGNVINVPALKIKYPNVLFVEDACEGLFGYYDGKSVGTESLLSSISFFGNKTITSGEGGAVLTNDTELYNYLKKLRGQGQSETKFIHDELGYNYRITNVQAAILYGQLMNVEKILSLKSDIFCRYDVNFCSVPRIHFQEFEVGTIPASWLYAIRIEGSRYNSAKAFFDSVGIETRPMFYPMSSHRHLKSYANIDDELVAKELNQSVVILPSYPDLTKEDQDYIIEKVKEYVNGL